MNNFQARLREAMQQKEVSQAELVKRTNLNKGLVSRYVNGHTMPSGVATVAIANALNVSPAWLMGFSDNMQTVEMKKAAETVKQNTEAVFDIYRDRYLERAQDLGILAKADMESLAKSPGGEEKALLRSYREADPEIQRRVRDLLGIGHSEKLAALRAIRDKAQESIDELEAMMRKFEQSEDE